MIDREANRNVTIYLRKRRQANCRRAARLLYQARQLGKAAEFIWRHRADADPDEIVGMRSATRFQASQLRAEARSLLTFCDDEILLL